MSFVLNLLGFPAVKEFRKSVLTLKFRRDHSRSLEMAPFDRSHTSSY